MTPLTLPFYAWTCGWTLARAHRAERDGGQETNGLEPGEYRAVNVGLHKSFSVARKGWVLWPPGLAQRTFPRARRRFMIKAQLRQLMTIN